MVTVQPLAVLLEVYRPGVPQLGCTCMHVEAPKMRRQNATQITTHAKNVPAAEEE